MDHPANSYHHLSARVEAIARLLVGRLGFSAQRLDGGPMITLNANERFPMASIFKIPIVLAALRRVQAGDRALDDIIEVPPDKYVMSEVISVTFIHPGVSLSLANLIEVMITHSNNTATDMVQDVAGGPGAVTAFLKEIGIDGMTVDRNTARFMLDFYSFESGLENIAQAVEFSMSDPVDASVCRQPSSTNSGAWDVAPDSALRQWDVSTKEKGTNFNNFSKE